MLSFVNCKKIYIMQHAAIPVSNTVLLLALNHLKELERNMHSCLY